MNSSHYSIKLTMNVLWAFFQLLANYHICIYLFLFFLGYLFRIWQPNSKRWRSYSWVEKNGTKNLKIYMHRHNMHYFLFLCLKSLLSYSIGTSSIWHTHFDTSVLCVLLDFCGGCSTGYTLVQKLDACLSCLYNT